MVESLGLPEDCNKEAWAITIGRVREAVHWLFGTDALLFGSAAYKLALWESDVDLSAAIPADKADQLLREGVVDDRQLAERVHELSMREKAAMKEYEAAQRERKVKHDLKQVEVRQEWKEQEHAALKASSVSSQRDVVDDGLNGLLAGAGEGARAGWRSGLDHRSDDAGELREWVTPLGQLTPMSNSQLPSPRQHWYDNRPILSPVPPSRPLPEGDARLSGLAGGASAGGHSLELSASVDDTISKLREIARGWGRTGH
ncbi:unnamed protein product [Vitrella brassicaformis CCMP3155]|uniref:Uncharacterized protein n=1 Tax=Vitrella brassicaformis (strain CCMP3155) TaxID=1169540 RepID=A0A0G4FSK7_VITBC|nr:unnamed protein product [Vitrella brassicaformis CCMP3155]|eukprot:CEM17691.1 unnamed protein product [Vitrella brassicaformis CCMP3155]